MSAFNIIHAAKTYKKESFMAKSIMIQGTMSSAGKSFVTTGLCRLFLQDGYRVAPFKSQNMSRNSFLTEDSLEMSAAQAVQAEAAGIRPSAAMNPILLKPVTDMGSQVIVNGISRGHMKAAEYFKYKKTLVPEVMRAYETLAAENDIIVIEGAGSPAEINLKQDDIVNMGLAKLTGSPVLLVGDIDCGGVFAQIVGTLVLLEEDERARVKGLVVNKFRGDIEIFRPGIKMLEERSGKPVSGVLPYLPVNIEEEDSLLRGAAQKERLADKARREEQYDLLAAALREHLDMELVYEILEGKR
jgi:adenosylcobyric acid synthase